MKLKKLILSALALLFMISLWGTTDEDTVITDKKQEKIKKGWTFGAVPAVTYNTDLGFQYGVVVNFFNYGDGTTYPKYHHNIYLEWSRYTKGSGVNQIKYDSEYLIPGIRVSAELSYLTEQALDFYGFNGYQTVFDKSFADDEDTANYISRMFYRMDRRMLRGKADFQGPIIGKKLRWMAGFEISDVNTGDVDIDKLNKGKDSTDMLPDADLLFENYKTWGLIPAGQAEGGTTTLLKLGAIYDTRDNEANPMKGIWSELQLLMAPSFLGNGDYDYLRLIATHRQYFTLVPRKLSLVYRLSYQGKLSGTMPFYMLPFVYNTAPDYTRDGVGGSKTVRGVVRNRIAGDGVVFGNIETRWKFYRGVVMNQNVYLALSAFLDGGLVVKDYELPVDVTTIPDYQKYFSDNDESLHMGYGGGLHIALNENFIVAADVAKAVKKEDGNLGVYIGLNFLF
jgi:hypothetical protein